VGLPWGAMYLECLVHFPDKDLAEIWPQRTPFKVVALLKKRGCRIIEIIDEHEAQLFLLMNFVALRPGEILMPANGIHCMTGLLKRDAVA